MSPLRIIRRLTGDCRGATAVEFALLAPAFIIMLFGVLQVGIALQNYNAMRSLSADIARYAMIEQAKGTIMSNSALITHAEDMGTGAPYLLIADKLDITIVPAATQQITNASELTLTINYEVPSVLASMGLRGPELDYVRPIFLSNS